MIDSDGVWSYTADNSNATIQALDDGQTLTDVFTVTSSQGTSTTAIEIEGGDEPPCFVSGTLIDTPFGPRLIKSLEAGRSCAHPGQLRAAHCFGRRAKLGTW